MNTKSIVLFARALGALAVAALIVSGVSHAQVPQIINYQGRVAVGTVNLEGIGQFKFALVDAAGTTTYWSNDGSSTAGSEPTSAVSIPVTKGLYSVLLGDAALPNMQAIANSVFNNSDVRLRVWFNDGANSSQRLMPDHRIAAVGYAMMAGNVQDGAITSAKIAAGAVGSAQLASGAVGSAQLASGAAAANLNSSGQSGVGSSGIILSSNANSSDLLNAGYIKLGQAGLAELWQVRGLTTAPSTRAYHTAVWTGSEMIVWGGEGNVGSSNDGGRYNPAGNTWTAVSTAGAPSARNSHTAVWTGSEMIIWGGYDGGFLNDGGRYNPTANTWTVVNTVGAPTPRYGHTAIWTGSEMIVWGGGSSGGRLNTGGGYNPTTDNWMAVSLTGAPAARSGNTAVWTGSEMIIWGGGNGSLLNDGGRYNPANNSWTVLSIIGAPAARAGHTAVWTGSEMIVWGGTFDYGFYGRFNDGGRYNPTGNSWTAMNTTDAPAARHLHTALWTGNVMIVWGGQGGFPGVPTLNDGGRYNPADNSWTALTTTGAPTPRYRHTAVWTGSEMIVWGGYNGIYFNDTISYTPGRLMYFYQRP